MEVKALKDDADSKDFVAKTKDQQLVEMAEANDQLLFTLNEAKVEASSAGEKVKALERLCGDLEKKPQTQGRRSNRTRAS